LKENLGGGSCDFAVGSQQGGKPVVKAA